VIFSLRSDATMVKYSAAGITIVLFTTMTFSATLAGADECKGLTPQVHNVRNFNFQTNSWVEEVENRRRYVSCVANLDINSDLPVDRKIPGPYRGWVPSTKVVTSARLRDDTNARPIDGCLEYGFKHDATSAEFLGTADDETANKGNKEQCGETVTETGPSKIQSNSLPKNGWKDEIRVFFPTDVNKPRDTMIEVTGEIGIYNNSDGYQSFFDYTAKRLDDRPDGDVDSVIVSPVFPNGKYFSARFAVANTKPLILGSKGAINFQIFGKPYNNWQAVQAYYLFEAKDGNVLAQIPLPLFQEVGH
jgi:hypothetical protein